jgi:hypothetical protein
MQRNFAQDSSIHLSSHMLLRCIHQSSKRTNALSDQRYLRFDLPAAALPAAPAARNCASFALPCLILSFTAASSTVSWASAAKSASTSFWPTAARCLQQVQQRPHGTWRRHAQVSMSTGM